MKTYLKIIYFTIAIIILHLAMVSVAQAADSNQTGTNQTGNSQTGYLMGRVTLPDESTGVPACEVQLLGKGDVPMARTTTDSLGNFYFTNLQPNSDTWGYRMIVKKGSWGQSTTQQFSVMEGSATILAIRIYPYIGAFSLVTDRQHFSADGSARANLTISLYDVEGKPVPDGVHVLLTQSSFYPDPGKFFGDAGNGTEIALATTGGKIFVQYGDVPGDTLARGVRIDAAVVESANSRSINLTIDLVNPNIITGTVYDATGSTVPYASVLLERWNGVGKFVGYNSTEGANATDGRGICDANGTYQYAVLPAGDYKVTASESTFTNSTQLTVVRGKYVKDLVLPMSRGNIKGWIKDANGNAVPGAMVTLNRVYTRTLTRMAVNMTDAAGAFSFDNMWYGNYDVQAVAGDQTADSPLVLDVPRTSVTLTMLKAVPVASVTLKPSASPGNVTPTAAPHGNVTVTPKPPTPTPPPVTGTYVVMTYGIAFAVIAVLCLGTVFVLLRFRSK